MGVVLVVTICADTIHVTPEIRLTGGNRH